MTSFVYIASIAAKFLKVQGRGLMRAWVHAGHNPGLGIIQAWA